MQFYKLEPEVAGGWGENTVADTSLHPPYIKKLHYEFDGWLGDGVLETFPCFIVTRQVKKAIQNAHMTGFEIDEVEISVSDEFTQMYGDKELPSWCWLKPIGAPGEDDIAITEKAELIISERTLEIFRQHGLNNCEISSYEG